MDTNQTGIGGLEITTFKLTGCTYPEFIIANTDIDYWLQRQPGFRSRHMAQKQDGTIIDMLLWDTVKEATQAMHRLMDEMASSPVHSMIDQHTVSWNVFPIGHELSR